MKIIDIPLSSIEIGARRRADYGDVGALAKGMKRVGLLQPIVVDLHEKDSYRLVAGARRIKAAQLLKWVTIPTSLREELTDEELHDLELEENENRKSLTTAERRKTFRASKHLVENAKKAKGILTPDVKNPLSRRGRGRPSKGAISEEEVAEAIGVGRMTLYNAEQHVDLAERFPWMQSDAWIQADVLRLRRNLKRIPVPEQNQLCQFIEQTAAPLEPRPDRVIEYAEIMTLKTPEERAQIYQLWQSNDDRDQSLARTRSLHRPPMPDVRFTFIHDALQILKQALKPPLDQEPESHEFHDIIHRLKALDERLDTRYQELKRREAQYVEEDIRRRKAMSA
jgi:hypothetical protein